MIIQRDFWICSMLLFLFAGIQRVNATCSETLHANDNVSCTKYCIEKFYDKVNCTGVYKGQRLADIIENFPKEILHYDYFEKSSSEIISVETKNCTGDGGDKIVYQRPGTLMSILDGTSEDKDKHYKDLIEKFDHQTKWCIETLGLDSLLDHKLTARNAMPGDIVDEASDISKTTTNTAEQVIQRPAHELLALLTNSNDPMETASIESSSTASTHITSTLPPLVVRELKKIVLEDHHYLEAIYFIGVIILIFSMTGLVLVGILFFFINRRKRFNVHNDSSAIPLQYL